MIRSQGILAAERIIKDADTKNVSIINVLDDLTVEGFPMIIQKMAVIIFLEKEVDDVDTIGLTFQLLNNTKQLFKYEIKLSFNNLQKSKAIINLQAVQFFEPGKGIFQILTNDLTVLAEYSINLVVRTPIVVN